MSVRASYDLLEKNWIPIIRDDGAPDSVGIRHALDCAHKIKSVSHTAPFIEFGLYRLLITIVLDAHVVAGRRPTIGKMRAMLATGQFDAELLAQYFAKYEEGFDLWGSKPFLQPEPVNDGGKKPNSKAIVTMFPAIPSGTNVAHWHHYSEDETTLSEDVAAQFLATVSPFNFKVKPGEARTLAKDPPMYALVLGQDLFETLVLNLSRLSGRVTAKQEKDNGPAWRTQLDLNNLPKVPTVGQGFTWPVRMIKLEKDGTTVSKAINQAAYKKPTEKAKGKGGNLYDAKYGWRDPSAGTESNNDRLSHIKARPGVPIWRDAIPLFLIASEGEALRGNRRRSRPEVITNALRVLDTPQFRVAVYGMRKKSGGGGDVKVEEWFRSVFKLPTEVARDSRLSARVIDAFKITQKVADTLQKALCMLRPPVKAGKNKRPPPARGETDVLAAFWQNLEPILTRRYLDLLGSNDAKAEEELYARVRRDARDAFAEATDPHRRRPVSHRECEQLVRGSTGVVAAEAPTGEEFMNNDDTLIRYLHSLKHEDTGTLAALRRACGQRLAESRNCQSFTSISTKPVDFLTATLAAQYSSEAIKRGAHTRPYKNKGSIGAAWAEYCKAKDPHPNKPNSHAPSFFYRKRQDDLSKGQSPSNVPSIHERFRTLLDAELDVDGTGELAYRLRGLVRMCVAADVPIDVIQLAHDLRGWRTESRYVQERWAKAFYGQPREINKQTQYAEDADNNNEQDETKDEEPESDAD